MHKEFVLKTKDDDILRVSVDGFENLILSPCLIIVHGFKGFKNWGFFPYVAERFAKKGYFVITFNFSHNGVGESLTEFDELEKFAKNTLSRELNELSFFIDSYKNGFFGKHENSTIGILGHSRGGGLSILTASQRNDISAVAVWSSVSDYDRYTERQKNEWKRNGYFEVMNSRTHQLMRQNYSFLEDIENNKEDKLNIEKAAGELKCPFLIVHGEQDLTVPVKEADRIFSWSNKETTKLVKIPSTGHTFNAKHPFEGSNSKLDMALEMSLEFFNRNLIN